MLHRAHCREAVVTKTRWPEGDEMTNVEKLFFGSIFLGLMTLGLLVYLGFQLR